MDTVRLVVVQQLGLIWPQGHPVAPQIRLIRSDSLIKDLKDRVSFSITSVIIIDYPHHQLHSCRLPAAVGNCQNIQVCPSSNCSPSTLHSFSSSSPQTASLIPPLCCPPLSPPFFFSRVSSEWGIFVIIISAVIVAFTVIVFTSLPPAEARTSNTQQVHYSSHSIISLTSKSCSQPYIMTFGCASELMMAGGI